MKKYIDIKGSDLEFLTSTFGVNERAVLDACHFMKCDVGEDTAKEIRRAAYERGGVLTAWGVLPGVKTYRTRTGALVYKYNNGYALVINKAGTRAKLRLRNFPGRLFDVSDVLGGIDYAPYLLRFAEL